MSVPGASTVQREPLNLARTKAALERFDVASAACSSLMGTGASDDMALAAMKVEIRARKKVQEAFADDTADRNPRATAVLVSPHDPWLRSLVKEYSEE